MAALQLAHNHHPPLSHHRVLAGRFNYGARLSLRSIQYGEVEIAVLLSHKFLYLSRQHIGIEPLLAVEYIHRRGLPLTEGSADGVSCNNFGHNQIEILTQQG